MCVAPRKKGHSRTIKRTASASSQQLPRHQQMQHIIFNNFSKPPLAQLSQILDRPSLGQVPTAISPQINTIITGSIAHSASLPVFNLLRGRF